MNERQQRLVAEFLADLNGKQAAIRVGYSAKTKTAESQASRQLRNVTVSEAIWKGQAKHLAAAEITPEDVLEQLRRLIMFDAASIYGPGGRLQSIALSSSRRNVQS